MYSFIFLLRGKVRSMAKKELALDPVCDMKIDPKTAAGKVNYEGRTIYFCSKFCEEEFKKNPKKYQSKIK
jgi:Cu+-exporting ATPase